MAFSQPSISWLSPGALTESEIQVFDSTFLLPNLVAKAAHHYKVPACAIALHSPGGMKLKACFGIEHEFVPQASDGCDPMCRHHTCQDRPIIIEDTKRCKRVQKDILVAHEPHVRFFAGAPLKESQMVFGTLCIFDWKPREFSQQDSEVLSQISHAISDLYARLLRKDNADAIMSELCLQDSFSDSQDGLSATDYRKSLTDTAGEEDVQDHFEDAEDSGKEAPTKSMPKGSEVQLPSVKFNSELSTTAGESESDSHSPREARWRAQPSATENPSKHKHWKPQPEMSLWEFLQLFKLETYFTRFEEEDIDMRSLPLLSDQDLESLGIKMGARRTLQAALCITKGLPRGTPKISRTPPLYR